MRTFERKPNNIYSHLLPSKENSIWFYGKRNIGYLTLLDGGINQFTDKSLSGSLKPYGWELYKTRKGKAGGVCVAIDLPTDNTHINDYQLLFQSTIMWYTRLILLAINFIVFISIGSDKNHSPAMIINVIIAGYKNIYKIMGPATINICSGSGIGSRKAHELKANDTLAIGITQ